MVVLVPSYVDQYVVSLLANQGFVIMWKLLFVYKYIYIYVIICVYIFVSDDSVFLFAVLKTK